jgi:hypothetical protein
LSISAIFKMGIFIIFASREGTDLQTWRHWIHSTDSNWMVAWVETAKIVLFSLSCTISSSAILFWDTCDKKTWIYPNIPCFCRCVDGRVTVQNGGLQLLFGGSTLVSSTGPIWMIGQATGLGTSLIKQRENICLVDFPLLLVEFPSFVSQLHVFMVGFVWKYRSSG